MVVGVTTGSAPAWLLTRRPSASVEAARQGRATTGHTRLQDGLVVTQVALAVVTLTAATLMLHSLLKLMAVPLGLRQQGVVLADLTLPPHAYPDADRVRLFYREALTQTERIPGVRSAAMMTTAPMSGIPWDASYLVEGQEPPGSDDENECDYVAVTGDYFRTLGIALTEGRAFSDRDDAGAIPVAVVNGSFSARHLAGGSPLGKRVSFPFMGGRPLEIVGAVEDVRRWGPEAAPRVTIYVPLAQSPSAIVTLAARTSHTQGMAASLRDALRRVDPNLPLANLRTMATVVSEASGTRRLAASSLATLGGIALCLSALGLYGALSRRVVSCRREIGIRLALGAQTREILRQFMRRGLWLTAAGAAAGSVLSLLLAPLLASLLFGVRPRDPVSLVVVLAAVLLAATLASSIPARRAASVDPAVVLRGE
jgi:putative ABC transport system permease protein